MAALPGTDWTDRPQRGGRAIASVRHIFTHFTLELDIVAAAEPAGRGWWQPLDGIDSAGLPTLYRRAVGAVLERSVVAPASRGRGRLEEAQVGP